MPMSCICTTARSLAEAEIAILNLRGRKANSGWKVLHWRSSSASTRGSTVSSGVTPAKWSVVMLRTQLPEVWMPCISTLARSASTSGTRSRSIQLYWMFWRVEKWP
ncbi:hypothetical protein D3C72_1407150 [compost metagenome]